MTNDILYHVVHKPDVKFYRSNWVALELQLILLYIDIFVFENLSQFFFF